jgi:hypothetical protein
MIEEKSMDSVDQTLSTIKKVRFLLPDSQEDMNQLEGTLLLLTQAYEDNLMDISKINILLREKIDGLTKELQEERKRVSDMEKILLQYNQHHPCGMINRKYFDYYMISATNRPATDQEWARFVKEFTFNTDKLNTAIYKWIEKVTGVPQGMP